MVVVVVKSRSDFKSFDLDNNSIVVPRTKSL